MSCFRFSIIEFFAFILIELQRRQEPPDRLQIDEITLIVPRISWKWKEVAYLTKTFATCEVEDIIYSRVSKDETAKSLIMVTCYMESNGNRNLSVDVLNKDNLGSILESVIGIKFIC